jgi:predicted transposase YbfD/YdcC
VLHPKKVGTLPVAGNPEALKRTNEIKMAAPLLAPLDLKDRDVTADALLTQRAFAEHLVQRGAHYHFTVKDNQPTVLEDLVCHFQDRKEPDFIDVCTGHGRIETRRIWVSSALNEYLQFPHIAQAYLIEREVLHKKSGKQTLELAHCITSRSAAQSSPARLLQINRGHWVIENSCHYILDWNFDEDRSRIRTQHGPENVTRLRRFVISLLKSKQLRSIAQAMRRLNRNMRLVFDYLCMSGNARRAPALAHGT